MGKTADNTGAAPAAPVNVEQLEKMLAEAGVSAEDIQVLIAPFADMQKLQVLIVEAQDAYNAKETECIELAAKVETLEAEVTAARETLKEMEEAITTAESKVVAKADEIVVDKVTYLVDPGNFKFEGEVVNANVLKENSKLAKKLIELGAGFIKKKGA